MSLITKFLSRNPAVRATRIATVGLRHHKGDMPFSDPAIENRRSESAAYDGPGKTTVSVLNQETGLLMVDSYSIYGFRLNNGMKAYGPIVILPICVLAWRVPTVEAITENSLAFFSLLNPRPTNVIIGAGEDPKIMDDQLLLSVRQKGINVEVFDVERAISTYNFLCTEGRLVAAALIPPRVLPREPNENDKYRTVMGRSGYFGSGDLKM